MEEKRELVFLPEQIGSRISSDFIAVKKGSDVRLAMSDLIAQAASKENVSTIYMVDEIGVLIGAIDLRNLIRARAQTPLEKIVDSSHPVVYAEEEIADCMERIKDTTEDSIPVLDSAHRLIGVLTAQELSRLIEEDLDEDYAMLGGLSAQEDLYEPLLQSIGKRLPWLIVLFGLGLLVSGVVGLFDRVVAELGVIVSFQSLILGMAGNVGTQSLAVTIRALSEDKGREVQSLRLVGKEARVGLCNGLLLGILSFGLIGAYLWLMKGETARLAFSVSLCTGVALLISMLLSAIFGTLIPILLKKTGIDPAVASGPFITTVNDLVAVVTYYGLAWMLLLESGLVK